MEVNWHWTIDLASGKLSPWKTIPFLPTRYQVGHLWWNGGPASLNLTMHSWPALLTRLCPVRPRSEFHKPDLTVSQVVSLVSSTWRMGLPCNALRLSSGHMAHMAHGWKISWSSVKVHLPSRPKSNGGSQTLQRAELQLRQPSTPQLGSSMGPPVVHDLCYRRPNTANWEVGYFNWSSNAKTNRTT